jgi:hypothetical protein
MTIYIELSEGPQMNGNQSFEAKSFPEQKTDELSLSLDFSLTMNIFL